MIDWENPFYCLLFLVGIVGNPLKLLKKIRVRGKNLGMVG